MAPTSVRMLLVEGENANGVTVEDTTFGIAADDDAVTRSAADQVISAILGTREGAAEAGHALTSTGVTWTNPLDAAALQQALATHKIENVMLVSAFMAAAALAQTIACTIGDAHTALLFLEPDTATVALIDSADGSITDVHKEPMSGGHNLEELAALVAGLETLDTRPQSVFVVGSGVDVAAIKPYLEAVTTLPVNAAEEPETALAWGAALASANAPLFASSTAALAYALDPGTGAVDPYAISPRYLAAPEIPFGIRPGVDDLAYSAIPDDEADLHTVAQNMDNDQHPGVDPGRRPLVLLGSILTVVVVAAALSLEVALALGIRPSVALLPRPLQNLIVQSPAPSPAPANIQVPQAHQIIAPAVLPPPANAPIPAPPRAVAVPAPPPAALPLPAAPPVPAAPPAPVVAPAPVVVPVPVPIPARPPAPVHVAPVHSPPAPVQLPPSPPEQFPAPKPPVYLPPQPVRVPAPQQPVLQLPIPGLPIRIPVPLPPMAPPQGPGVDLPGGVGGGPGSQGPGLGGNPGFGGSPGFGDGPSRSGGMPGFGGSPGGGFGGEPGGGHGFGGFGGEPGGGHGFGGFGGGHGFGGGLGGFGGGHGGGFGGGGHR